VLRSRAVRTLQPTVDQAHQSRLVRLVETL